MNAEELVIVGAYELEDEAYVAKTVLDGEGIESSVLGSESSGFGALSNDAAFQLVVKRSEYEKARAALEHAESNADELAIPAWTCQCGEEVDEGFAVCWSCGADWPDADKAD